MSINDAEVRKQVSIWSIFSTFYSFVISVSLALHVFNPPARFRHWGSTPFLLQIEHMMAFIEQEAKEKVDEIDAKVFQKIDLV